MKLLIVDDNPVMRQVIRRLLADLAEDIRECADGDEAVALYRTFQPDWVLMDWQMPRLNGLAATRQIIGDDPDARIVIVTGYDDPSVRAAAEAAGACGYVLKENLLEVRQWLQAGTGPRASPVDLESNHFNSDGGTYPRRIPMKRMLTPVVLSLAMLAGWALWHVAGGGTWLAAARDKVSMATFQVPVTGNAAVRATSFASPLAPLADGPVCTSFTNRTTANGLGNNRVYGVVVVGGTIYAATDGGLSISTNGGATFSNRTTAQGLGDNSVNAVFVVGSTIYAATRGGLSISYNGGATFSNRTTAQGLTVNDVACVYVVGNTVYVGTGRGVSISTDGGNSFSTSLDDVSGYFVGGIHVEGNTIYVASELYGLFISINSGASYTQRTTANGLASNRTFGIYAFGGTIYVATQGGLSLTTNAGASFSNRLLGRAVQSVYAIGNTVYAGTTVYEGSTAGLALSTDGGASFTNVTTAQGLGSNEVYGVFATSTSIYAATLGGLSLCPPPPLVTAITVSGNNNLIVQGSTTPSTANDTDFGRVYLNIGSSLHTFTIANLGSATLNLTGTPNKVVINGANASDFTVTTQPASPVAANGGQTTFQITFRPSAIGTRTATVSIANNDPTKNPYTFTIQGTGGVPAMAVSGYNNVIANGSLSPSTSNGTDFGSRAIGITPIVRDFTISNTGGVQLALTGTPKVALIGSNAADFSIAVQPVSPVAALTGTTTFLVHFAPTATGIRTATISIANNDPTKNPYTFAIQGTGTPRPLDPICTNFTSRLSEDTYGVYAQGNSIYVGGRTGLHISTDGGASFSKKTMAQGLGANWVHKVFAQGNTIYAATGDGVANPGDIRIWGGLSTSTNGGASFSNRGFGGFDRDFTQSVYAVGNRIYAGTSGNFNLSTDGGTSFVQKLDLPSYDVYAEGSMVYVATFWGLYISNNGGESFFRFVDRSPTFENYEPYGVCAQGNSIYVATEVGLYISTDGGVSFSKRTTAEGLGDNWVNDVYAVGNTIYAATIGGLSISTDGGSNFINYGLGNAVQDVHATATGIYAATEGGLSFCKAPVCSTITGTMSGGGAICATQSSSVRVTVSGGVAPYTVTLTNGGGTQTGNGPTFTFSVTPGATTSYQVAVGSKDANNCPITSSGTATVTMSPVPTTANAGPDQTVCGTSATLAANAPTVGAGAWTIVSGAGGSVTTPSSRTSAFTGVAGTSYTLRWTISNAPCTASTDTVVINLRANPTTANAGPDQTVCGTSTTLAANAPTVGTGAWSIVSGTGGTVTTPSSRTSAFTGLAGTSYTLRWTISNAPCTASTDTVVINFNKPPALTYAAAAVSQGGSTTINPLTGPSDDGSITSIAVQSVTPTFGGTIAVNNVSGQVSVGNAAPPGSYSVVIRATDNCGSTTDASFTMTVTNGGLQFYPLAHPVRLLETRVGFTGCDSPAAKIVGGTSRTQTAAGRTCDGLTIPANAAALVGNATSVQSGGGYFTLYPSDIAKPNSANSNYAANQILNSLFTVRLGASDGAFNIFVSSDTDIVVDITGYYAPPSASGLYFHPLPKPVRLLDTRQGQSACFTPGVALQGNTDTSQLGTTTCDGVLIPAGAQALVGNATTVSPQANGFLTLYPADAARPLIASANFQPGVNLNSPFMVGLSPSGQFNMYVASTTDLVVDVTGYYSTQLNDANGQGLLFNALTGPTRLLDTRAGQSGCFTPSAQMVGGTSYLQPATGACSNVPATAQAVVGNATAINATANGYLTFWPSDANQPFIATSNYRRGVTFNRHFTVGLGNEGAFKRYAASTTDLVVDLVGYFAP